jgi:hypothetical protein
MALFRVVLHVDAPPARVWDLLTDWEGSTEWMVDATTVEVLPGPREGVGTRVRAVTTIAALIPITDIMEVTRWEPGRLIQVRHERRPIKGPAWFAIYPENGGTRFEWGENLEPPLGFLGEIGARILRRPIEAVLRASADKLRTLAERSR